MTHENCNDYYFIYKDMFGRWNECTNPVFIAEHKKCMALRKELIGDINEHLKMLNLEKYIKG